MNNSGTTPEDSINIPFQMLDSIGVPQSVLTGDSCWVYCWYPSGQLAFADSCRLLSDAKITTRRLKFRTLTADYFNYRNSIANLDGSGGFEGTYKWTLIAGDSSANGAPMITVYNGEFQVYAGPDAAANFSDKLDSITQIPTGEITTGSFAAGAINDAATASDMETAIGLAGWNTAFSTSFTAGSMGDSANNSSWEQEVNYWKEGIVPATSATGVPQVNITSVTDGAIDDVDIDNDVQVDVLTWKAGTIPAPTTTGVPIVTTKYWGTSTTALAANVEGMPVVDLDSITVGAGAGSVSADELSKTIVSAGPITTSSGAVSTVTTTTTATTATNLTNWPTSAIPTAGVNSVWTATGGDSVLQALDYTNNNAHLIRRAIDSILYANNVNLDAINGDTSAASGVEGAFDNVQDTSVTLDLAHLTVIAPRNDASIYDNPVTIREHGKGRGIYIASDSAGGGGIYINTSGAAGGGRNAAGIEVVASGASSDAVWLNSAGSGSKKGIEFTGPIMISSVDAGASFFQASDNTPRRADFDIYSYAAGVGAYIDASNMTQGAADKIAYALAHMTNDTAGVRWATASDTSFAFIWARYQTYLQAIRDSMDEAAAGGGGGSCSACGSGTQVDTIKVADTTGTYTLVPNAYVEVYDNATGLTKQAWGVTGSTGRLVVNLSASTAYRVNVVKAGYTFPQHVWTTGAGANYADSANGYDVAISNPSAANLKRIYDYIYTFCGDSVQGADVVVELLTPDSTKIAYDSTTGVSLGKNPVVYTTQTLASGLFTVDLIPNNYIIPHGTRYQVTVMAGRRTIYSVKINATGTAQAVVRSLQ